MWVRGRIADLLVVGVSTTHGNRVVRVLLPLRQNQQSMQNHLTPQNQLRQRTLQNRRTQTMQWRLSKQFSRPIQGGDLQILLSAFTFISTWI